MAGTNFSKVWASMLAGVLAAGLPAARQIYVGARYLIKGYFRFL
jgi:hypothetical protein